MALEGCTQLTYIIIAPPDQAAEGARLFQSHKAWMEGTHHRDGEKALLSYEVSTAPELTDPLDASSEPTGNTIFVLTEVYRSDAGIADHFAQAEASWQDFEAVGAWMEKCDATLVPSARVVHSLW